MYIGLVSFAFALLLTMTAFMLSDCTRSPYNEPPPTPADRASSAEGGRQSTGWLDLESYFEDSKKIVAGVMGGGSGACGNDPAIIGEWVSASRNTMKISFTECIETVSQLNGCSGTYSYSTKNGVLSGKLMTVKPSYCGQVGSLSTAQYAIEGSTLTVRDGRGTGVYRRGG